MRAAGSTTREAFGIERRRREARRAKTAQGLFWIIPASLPPIPSTAMARDLRSRCNGAVSSFLVQIIATDKEAHSASVLLSGSSSGSASSGTIKTEGTPLNSLVMIESVAKSTVFCFARPKGVPNEAESPSIPTEA